MLVGFLIKDEDDWIDWKERITSLGKNNGGKAIVHIFNTETVTTPSTEREGALDEVEALDDSELEE